MIDYKAIIFDMDGTLIDSMSVWVEVDKKFAVAHGAEYDHNVSENMKSMHFNSACQYLADVYGLAMTAEEVAAELLSYVEDTYSNGVQLKPYAYEFVCRQHENGVKMCVATSNKKSLAKAALKNLGIYDMLEFVLTSDEVGNDKHSPDIFLKSAEMLGAKPQDTLVFEDSVHAVKSSMDAGFYTIAICDEHSPHEHDELKKLAHWAVHGFDEVE